MPSDGETLAEIIERVTVDAYGDEGYWSFLCAFEEEVAYPLAASLAGTTVSITSVDFDGLVGRGLVANIENPAGHHQVALLDLALPPGPAHQLVDAYRKWLGLT